MVRIKKRNLMQLALSIFCFIVWVYLFFNNFVQLSHLILLILGFFLTFLLLTVIQITFRIDNMIELDIKDFKKIWWGRVFVTLLLSVIVVIAITFRLDNQIVSLVNTSAFGIVLGYMIARMEENRKTKGEGKQLIEALLFEISNSRYKGESIVKGHPPAFFETFIWDNLRLSKHFKILWTKDQLTNKLFNLYLSISGANWRINLMNIATSNTIIAPGATATAVLLNTEKMLKDFLGVEVLPRIIEAQTELEAFIKSP